MEAKAQPKRPRGRPVTKTDPPITVPLPFDELVGDILKAGPHAPCHIRTVLPSCIDRPAAAGYTRRVPEARPCVPA